MTTTEEHKSAWVRTESPKEKRKKAFQKIQSLRKRQDELGKKIMTEYPAWPHDGISEQEMRDRSEYGGLPTLIAQASDEYSILVMESSEEYLEDLSSDTKDVKYLTGALVALTIVLAVSTILDFLYRAGIL